MKPKITKFLIVLWWASFSLVVYLSFCNIDINWSHQHGEVMHNHIAAYAWLSVLAYYAFDRKKYYIYMSLLMLSGIIIEFVQQYFGRHLLVSDMLMNAVGISAGLAVSLAYRIVQARSGGESR